MNVAIVHDYLNQLGGGEKVMEDIKNVFSVKDVYVIDYDPKKVPLRFNKWNIKTSFIAKLPKIWGYKFYFPIFPLAVESIDVSKYDLVISSSHAWVKSVKTNKRRQLHICYCYTPARYFWSDYALYIGSKPFYLRWFYSLFVSYLRLWDRKTANRVDYFVAISKNVRKRIKKYYKQDSIIIYPGIDTKFFRPIKKSKDDYYLIVSRLKLHKRIDIAINAFNKLGYKLIIVGSGSEYNKLRKIAKKNIPFTGQVSDKDLLKYYQNCKALIFPGEEDFGLVPVEAQSCGKPVIAYGKGGALETVISGKTGLFFNKQTPESLIEAVKKFEKLKFKPADCRKNALKFDKEIFKEKIKKFVNEKAKNIIKR